MRASSLARALPAQRGGRGRRKDLPAVLDCGVPVQWIVISSEQAASFWRSAGYNRGSDFGAVLLPMMVRIVPVIATMWSPGFLPA